MLGQISIKGSGEAKLSYWLLEGCDTAAIRSDMEKSVIWPIFARKGKRARIHVIEIFDTLVIFVLSCNVFLGHLFACANAFLYKLFCILFKSSRICKIFWDPRSPGLTLLSCVGSYYVRIVYLNHSTNIAVFCRVDISTLFGISHPS